MYFEQFSQYLALFIRFVICCKQQAQCLIFLIILTTYIMTFWAFHFLYLIKSIKSTTITAENIFLSEHKAHHILFFIIHHKSLLTPCFFFLISSSISAFLSSRMRSEEHTSEL